VSITLELKLPKFTRWSAFFLSLCGKLGLHPHIDGTMAMCPDDPTCTAPSASAVVMVVAKVVAALAAVVVSVFDDQQHIMGLPEMLNGGLR